MGAKYSNNVQKLLTRVCASRELDQWRDVESGVCVAQGRQVVGSEVGGGGEFGASPGERFGAQVGDEQIGGQACVSAVAVAEGWMSTSRW